MPAHPLALELIRLAGVPIAAPSANRFGRTSPTTAAHVLEDLNGRISAVLDGGPTTVGLESTVFDVSANTIYRPGGVSRQMLENILGPVEAFQPPTAQTTPESLPSPGVGIRHYAPRARLVLVNGPTELAAAITKDAGVMLPDGWNSGVAKAVFPWGPWNDAETLARRLFAGLRQLDETAVPVIVCPVPEMGGLGDAIRDRLKKAAREK